jgi:hypothetical protein
MPTNLQIAEKHLVSRLLKNVQMQGTQTAHGTRCRAYGEDRKDR